MCSPLYRRQFPISLTLISFFVLPPWKRSEFYMLPPLSRSKVCSPPPCPLFGWHERPRPLLPELRLSSNPILLRSSLHLFIGLTTPSGPSLTLTYIHPFGPPTPNFEQSHCEITCHSRAPSLCPPCKSSDIPSCTQL